MNIRQPLLGALLVLSAQAGASTTYVYTGTPYTNILNDKRSFGAPEPSDIIPGTYDTSMSVTGSVELENPLGANLSDFDAPPTVLNFSFFDGRNTIDKNSDGLARSSFRFNTNAQGEITFWDFGLIVGDPSLQSGGRNHISSFFAGVLIEFGSIDTTSITFGRTSDFGQSSVPGVWSIQTTPVPVPPSLWLLGPTIVGLGLARRRTA